MCGPHNLIFKNNYEIFNYDDLVMIPFLNNKSEVQNINNSKFKFHNTVIFFGLNFNS